MNSDRSIDALVDNELDVLAALVPVAGRDINELGCGAAKLARSLVERHPDSRVTGLEVDERQHAKNLASPQPGLNFGTAGAQDIPFPPVDAALRTGAWEQVAERFFETPVSFKDFADFEQRMMRPTFADHRIHDAKLATVDAVFAPHMKSDGAHFTRPMHVRVLCKLG